MKVEKDKIKVSIRECKDVEIICPECGEKSLFYDVDTGISNYGICWNCGSDFEFYVDD